MVPTDEDTKVSNRRNLYVRDADLEVWRKAEELGGDLSPLVSQLLRRYVDQREAAKDRIVVEIEDRDGNVTRKAFKGRMLIADFQTDNPESDLGTRFLAAQGQNGGLALWTARDDKAKSFLTYESFVDAEDEDFGSPADGIGWPRDFLSAVSSALGEEYAEEIDL